MSEGNGLGGWLLLGLGLGMEVLVAVVALVYVGLGLLLDDLVYLGLGNGTTM